MSQNQVIPIILAINKRRQNKIKKLSKNDYCKINLNKPNHQKQNSYNIISTFNLKYVNTKPKNVH